MINKNNLQDIFKALDLALKETGNRREITIFGSAALMALNILTRETVDLDMVDPPIDNELQTISADVGEKYGLEFGWLNSAGHIFSRNFPKGWKDRTKITYRGNSLTVKILDRRDLIATKLNAACQRGLRDIEDLVALTPSGAELKSAKKWVLSREKSQTWPEHVDNVLKEITKNLKLRGKGLER